jgi:hypothetical protein
MNIIVRIKKLERQKGANDKFCRCGTPYFATFVIGGENIINNVCSDCGRNVRPRTRAEFAIDAHKYSFEVIEPNW